MADAISHSLAMAVGVAISPIPVIAAVLMLATPLARGNGTSFLLGWLLGLAIVGTTVLVIAKPAGDGAVGGLQTWVSWIETAAAALLLGVAVRQFRARPPRGQEATLPTWIGVVDGIRPTMALGLGALLAGLNPKNLLLVVAGAVAITETGIPAGQQAAAYTVFAFVGSLGVAVPLVIYLATGDRAPETLARLKRWLGLHNNVITSGLCLVVAAKLVSDAVPALVG